MSNDDPAVGQPEPRIVLPSSDDFRMAAMGLEAYFDHHDWRSLADRLRAAAESIEYVAAHPHK